MTYLDFEIVIAIAIVIARAGSWTAMQVALGSAYYVL